MPHCALIACRVDRCKSFSTTLYRARLHTLRIDDASVIRNTTWYDHGLSKGKSARDRTTPLTCRETCKTQGALREYQQTCALLQLVPDSLVVSCFRDHRFEFHSSDSPLHQEAAERDELQLSQQLQPVCCQRPCLVSWLQTF